MVGERECFIASSSPSSRVTASFEDEGRTAPKLRAPLERQLVTEGVVGECPPERFSLEV